MIKLVKTIVQPDGSLMGFVAEGRDKDFGGIGTNKVKKNISLQELISRNVKTSQVSIENGKVVMSSNFKMNSLPMVVFTGTEFIPVDNTINITKRFVKDNENIGFEITFSDGTTKNLEYNNVGRLTSWYKPGNFTIRTSSTGKYFISGKPGVMRLADLPAEVISGDTKKRTKSAAKAKNNITAKEALMTHSIDILDIYDFLEPRGGFVMMLPDAEYVAKDSSTKAETEKSGFQAINFGELAKAKPLFAYGKLNVNAAFRKPGVVTVNLSTRGDVTHTVYVNRTKNIFYNGNNKLKKFGVVIPVKYEKEMISTLGSSLSFKKIVDPTMITMAMMIVNSGREALSLYTVNAENIALISKDKAQKSILSDEEITNLVKERLVRSLVSKALGTRAGLLKELKATLGSAAIASAKSKTPMDQFKDYSVEELAELEEAGIDVYTGAFDTYKAAKAKPAEEKAETDAKTEKAATTPDITVEYGLVGSPNLTKYTYKVLKDLCVNGKEDSSALVNSLVKLLRPIFLMPDDINKYKKATEEYEATMKRIEAIDKKLWMHTAGMYEISGKTAIHTHDKAEWKQNTDTRFKKGIEYVCEAPGAHGLYVRTVGVDIR